MTAPDLDAALARLTAATSAILAALSRSGHDGKAMMRELLEADAEMRRACSLDNQREAFRASLRVVK